MNKFVMVGILLLVVVTSSAHALEWKAEATHMTVLRPRPDPQDGKVTAKGFHRVYISQWGVVDAYFPVRFRIKTAKLLENGAFKSACSTGWVWAKNSLSTICKTSAVRDPCQSAVWQSSTQGQLQNHPDGGHQLAFSKPTFLDCECV